MRRLGVRTGHSGAAGLSAAVGDDFGGSDTLWVYGATGGIRQSVMQLFEAM